MKALCPSWADTEIVSGVGDGMEDGAERKVATNSIVIVNIIITKNLITINTIIIINILHTECCQQDSECYGRPDDD